MSQNDSYDDFFSDAEVVYRDPAGGARFKTVGDLVHGDIVDVYKMPYTDASSGERITGEKNGQVVELDQLVVTVQTDHRNWEAVNKVPQRKDDNGNKVDIPAGEDTGRRNIYVAPNKNLYYTIARAIAEASPNGKPAAPKVGDYLAVKFESEKDTGKPSKLKQFAAVYRPGSGVGNPFEGAPAATAPAPQQEAPEPTPAPTPAPAADPFATSAPAQAAPASNAPPF